MALKFIRQLYSLDTLDTRFIVPATAPPKEALEEAKLDPAGPVPVKDGRDGSKSPENKNHHPLWNTPEFYFYYVAILTSVFFMFKLVLDVSQGSCSAAERKIITLTVCRIPSELLKVRPSSF
jgi:hypothetical protein